MAGHNRHGTANTAHGPPGRDGRLARVPLFLLALLAVRGLPALLGLRANGTRPTVALGLLQATSLPFIVTATQIGAALGKLSSVTAAALVCAWPALGADLPADSRSGCCAGTSQAPRRSRT